MKRLLLLSSVAVLISSFGTSAMANRVWNRQMIVDSHGGQFNCGYQPTMALLYGVQPVISNYDGRAGSNYNFKVLRQTAFGWSDYSVGVGYIDGNGQNVIQSSVNPIIYGQDGRFYSTAEECGVPLHPVSLDGYSGPEWVYGGNYPSFVSADPNGTVYMASGGLVAQSLGSKWSEPVEMHWNITYDLAISAYGDIALSGNDGSGALVSWYDFKSGTWLSRRLFMGGQAPFKVDVEWDKQGNLGVAYVDLLTHAVKFDYMSMQTSYWTSEIVGADQCSGFSGAALDYDRFGNPVIASGNVLFYDPVAVPEPSSLMIFAMAGLGLLARKKRL